MTAAIERPLWSLCTMNDDVLSESTDREFSFEYVDISNVSEGHIADDVQQVTFGAAPSRARRLARPGDVLVSTVRTYLRAIAQVGENNMQRVYSTGFAVLRPMISDTDPRYVAYVLTSNQVMDEIVATSSGVSYPAISGTALHRIRVPHNSLEDQKRIADYLDRETGEIDAMLAKMDELTQTLEARRKHVIMKETRQIGLTAGFDSGGRLPDGWSLTPLRFAVADAQTGVWGEEPNGGDDDVLCARVADFDRAKLRVTDVPTIRRVAAKDRDKCSLRRGDILVEKSGGTNRNPVGTVISYEGEIPAVYANFIMRLRMAKGHNSRFWLYALHGSYSNGRTWNFVRQTTGIQNLDVNGFLSMPHAAPLLDEQIRIADHLDEITGKIDQMLAKTAELKNLLIERRAALITDVVTGKKQVP